MCMLFGFTGEKEIELNKMIKSFFKFSVKHPDGWGIASFKGEKRRLSMIKQQLPAYKSELAGKVTDNSITGSVVIAHIRRSSRGVISYNNTHPFIEKIKGKDWVFAHNGTIDAPEFKTIKRALLGNTDSEKISCYMAERLEELQEMSLKNACQVIERCIRIFAPRGKMNFIISDGTHLFVHTNFKDTLHMYSEPDHTIIATEPIADAIPEERWTKVPMNRLLVFKAGERVYEGKIHDYEYYEKVNLVRS